MHSLTPVHLRALANEALRLAELIDLADRAPLDREQAAQLRACARNLRLRHALASVDAAPLLTADQPSPEAA